jgi:hypothetical protein
MADNIWTKLENKNSLMQKGTQYRNMQAWSRPCALCKKEFVAYTPGNSPADKAPTVTTCEEHRGAPNGISYGWLAWDGKNVVPGPKMKTGGAVDSEELAEAKALAAEYAEGAMNELQRSGVLKRENDELKAKLARYELQPAMQQAKPFNAHELLAAETAQKMPWEG